jgi:hypothetical protein
MHPPADCQIQSEEVPKTFLYSLPVISQQQFANFHTQNCNRQTLDFFP